MKELNLERSWQRIIKADADIYLCSGNIIKRIIFNRGKPSACIFRIVGYIYREPISWHSEGSLPAIKINYYREGVFRDKIDTYFVSDLFNGTVYIFRPCLILPEELFEL